MTPKKIKKIYLNDVDENGSDMQKREYIDLSQVWHDVSEIPKDGKRICVHFGEDNCGIYTQSGMGENRWCNWCKVVHALRWAYVSDLLPKQSGNSEQLKGGEE